jgi:phage gp46-like protein
MATIIERAPKYRNGYLEIDNTGNIILEQPALIGELQMRIRTRRGTYPFDLNFGSQLYKIINSRGISPNQVTIWAREALESMIAQKKIKSTLVIIPRINQNRVIIEITATTTSGQVLPTQFFSYLVN